MNSSRPPPPGAPPQYAFVNKVYRRNLRPVVISIAFLSALWALFSYVVPQIMRARLDPKHAGAPFRSGIGFFRSVSIDKQQHFQKLATFSIALGALYMGVAGIEAFGVIAALSRRLALVRIYMFLSVLAALTVAASGLTRTVVHFTNKNDLITECTNSTTGDTVYRFGLFGPISTDRLDGEEAADWCNDAWKRDSWYEIISLLVTMFLAGLFCMVVFSFYRQILDPTSPANALRAPSNQVRMGAFPAHYNPPYNASVPNLGYNTPYAGGPGEGGGYYPYHGGASGQFAPPPGPPPHDDAFAPPYDGKPPGYGIGAGEGKYGGEKDDKDDPFSDDGREEHDVTSRPAPGGKTSFL